MSSKKKVYYYMRLKEDFFNTDVISILENQTNGKEIIVLLIKMYLKSLKNDGKIMINDEKAYSIEMLSSLLKIEISLLNEAIELFKNLEIIEIFENGIIYMNDIELFVGSSSNEAERKRIARRKIDDERTKDGQNADICRLEIRDYSIENKDHMINDKKIKDKAINDKEKLNKKISLNSFAEKLLKRKIIDEQVEAELLSEYFDELETLYEKENILRALNYTINRIPKEASDIVNYLKRAISNNLKQIERNNKNEELYS
ncbi:MAG: phage replisome organizer N-terminal domain-containing protein [Fusobacteriaceae bacterium]|nr:phage replisome organizer N-terminal domain-containing protein [Fusobacteriaceae bacterium]